MQYKDGLETERLCTRFLQAEDAIAWVEFFRDPINTTYLPNPDMLTEEARAEHMISFQLKRYEENRQGLQALITKDTGEFIGMCGLLTQEMVYNNKIETEVGYHLLRRFWGRGYASEAAITFRDYAFNNSDKEDIVSVIHPLNFPSKNVAIRNGMTLRDRGILFKGGEYDVFRISREEWKGLK